MGERQGPLETLVNPDTSFWSGWRVLLTGHTGFKGSWLALSGLIQSQSQARWPELPALGSLSGLAPSLCAKPALLQPI